MNVAFTEPEETRFCSNCKKPVTGDVQLCPNCGATVPPLPILNGKPVRDHITPFITGTGSRKKEIAVGVTLGIVLVPIFVAMAIGICSLPPSRYDMGLLFIVATLVTVVLPITIAYLLKRKHHVAGDAMQKTLCGWVLLLVFAIIILYVVILIRSI